MKIQFPFSALTLFLLLVFALAYRHYLPSLRLLKKSKMEEFQQHLSTDTNYLHWSFLSETQDSYSFQLNAFAKHQMTFTSTNESQNFRKIFSNILQHLSFQVTHSKEQHAHPRTLTLSGDISWRLGPFTQMHCIQQRKRVTSTPYTSTNNDILKHNDQKHGSPRLTCGQVQPWVIKMENSNTKENIPVKRLFLNC